jgi:hypothetical protein
VSTRTLAALTVALHVVALGLGVLAALMLFGGCAFRGPGQTYARCGLGSPARHNVEPMIGAGYEWDTGAEVEVQYRPWFRVEEPSTRGFPQEIGRVYGEVKIPLGGR